MTSRTAGRVRRAGVRRRIAAAWASAVLLGVLAGCAPAPSSAMVTVGFSDVHSTATNEFIIAPAHHKAIRVTLRAGFYRGFTVPMHVKTRVSIVDVCSTDWTPTEGDLELRVTVRNPRFEGDTPRCDISDGKSGLPSE